MTTDIDSMNERAARAFARDAYRQLREAIQERDELLEACKRAVPSSPKRKGSDMSKHTPGPWTVHHFLDNDGMANCPQDCGIYEIEEANETIVGHQRDGNHGEAIIEAEANAKLIAAAPDLLAACKRLLEEVSDPRIWGRYVDRARAAIAKAKGEQHARGRAMIRGDIWECDCPECSKRLTLRHLNPLAFCSSCTTWYSVDWREGDLHGLSRTIAKAKGE